MNSKARELRDMADDQIRLIWKDAAESLFRLKLKAQTEKLTAPTEVRKFRRTIARCQTVLVERGASVSAGYAADLAATTADTGPRQAKQARKRRLFGRAKLKAGRGAAAARTMPKRAQRGK
jgi:large subunit ribosomal protein L29